jgi:hypothetical protein
VRWLATAFSCARFASRLQHCNMQTGERRFSRGKRTQKSAWGERSPALPATRPYLRVRIRRFSELSPDGP